jgi:hypothetical protein
MKGYARLSIRDLSVGIALIAVACVDPFHPDATPLPGQTPTPPPTDANVDAPAAPAPAYDAALPPSYPPPTSMPDAGPVNPDAPVAVTPDAAVPAPDAPLSKPDAAPADRPPRPDGPPPVIVDCPNPSPPDGGELECPVDPAVLKTWFPVTPAIKGCRPAPHPAVECLFYQFAWQNFLIATQPDAQGRPAFLGWNTIENTFGAHAGEPAPAVPFLSGGVTQAGGRQVLVDQKGHAIYYGIHMNKAFVDFVNENGLTSAQAIRDADPNLAFPSTNDIVELKTAWTIVDDANPPANFFTTRASVGTLHVVNNRIEEDRVNLRPVTVALIAVHVVYTLPGHPEFIWSSFQHVDAAGLPDVAPSAAAQPAATRATTVISNKNHILFKAGTTAGAANRGVIMNPMFDEVTQTFAAAQMSSIYRLYPGSKSNDVQIDDDVSAITDNMIALFKTLKVPAADKRPNYYLVGAVWQDRPEKSFKVDKVLVNDQNDPDIRLNGGDSDHSITGGEDSLSSTAMESFTQGANSFPNCFSCHDTRTATVTGVPAARDTTAAPTLQPKLINVSHVFNEVVREGL